MIEVAEPPARAVSVADAIVVEGLSKTYHPPWLRLIVTFVIPIAVATTVPLQALRGELAWWQVLLFLAVSAASLLVATQVWGLGVRRYSGASS